MTNTLAPQFWFIEATTGAAWQVTDPSSWCLEHAREPILAPARDRLLVLSNADADRIVRLVVRRCRLNLVEVQTARVVVHFWSRGGLAQLRPLFKQLSLARPSIEVFCIDRKREAAVVCPAIDFLFGNAPSPAFSWPAYFEKWRKSALAEPDDWRAAPDSSTNFSWEGVQDERIPWAVLKRAWGREAAAFCLNCDTPLFLTGFWFVRSKSDVIWRACFRCHRQFEDRSLFVLRWMVRHLEPDLWPASHHQLRAATHGVLQQVAEMGLPPEKPAP